MLLGEPPPTQYDLNFPLLGFPVRINPWFWLMALILGSSLQKPAAIITWVVAVFLSILVHELGHALVMRTYGIRPWIVLYAMGGLTCYDPRDSFRSKGSDWLGQVLISLAGPVAGFLLAALIVLVVAMAGYGQPVDFRSMWGLAHAVQLPNLRLTSLLNDIFFISAFWGLINLMPVYPLDGGQIAREILLKLNPCDGIRQSLLLSTFVGAALAVFGLVKWHDMYVAFFFGYLAYASFATLQAYSSRRPW